MKRYYANLLGQWVDITDEGTVEDHQNPSVWFRENLGNANGASCGSDYIHVQYGGKDYRIHPSMIQIVTE